MGDQNNYNGECTNEIFDRHQRLGSGYNSGENDR